MTNRLSDREFKELVRQIDIDQSGDIKRFEFVKAMQSMVITSRLLGTAPSKAGSLHECFVYDYSIEGFRYRSTSHPKSPLLIEEFLHEPSGPISPHKVRWIHVVGDHIGTLLGIASKYGLNNFEIEDALSGTERSRMVEHCFDSRPWFESGGHVQIIIRVVRPKKKPPLRLKEEQLTIFCTNNTVITIQQKPNSVVFFKLQTRISGSAPKLDDEKTSENSFSSGKFVVSKIRRNGSEFLVYSIIDRIVDCANSTLYRFNKELIRLERDVNSPKDTPPNTMVQVHRVKREMATLLDCLRPLHQTVLKLIESLKIRIQRRHQVLEKGKRISEREFDGFGLDQQQVDLDIVDWNELVAGYSDIKDHIELMNAQVTYLHSWCITLNDQFQNYQSHRMNEVMYLLTLITTFFVPAQFLTGVYGMNFDFMPELSWKYSYLLFWLLILAIGLCTYFYFKRKRWV
jgi:Mg2+ and Co2+ transporter CorA